VFCKKNREDIPGSLLEEKIDPKKQVVIEEKLDETGGMLEHSSWKSSHDSDSKFQVYPSS
jgi:hypothetical protein